MVHANIQRLNESWLVSSPENMKNTKDMGVWSSPWGFWDVDEEEGFSSLYYLLEGTLKVRGVLRSIYTKNERVRERF